MTGSGMGSNPVRVSQCMAFPRGLVQIDPEFDVSSVAGGREDLSHAPSGIYHYNFLMEV